MTMRSAKGFLQRAQYIANIGYCPPTGPFQIMNGFPDSTASAPCAKTCTLVYIYQFLVKDDVHHIAT